MNPLPPCPLSGYVSPDLSLLGNRSGSRRFDLKDLLQSRSNGENLYICEVASQSFHLKRMRRRLELFVSLFPR